MEPLVSVIVPVYKTEKFLEICIDSILNQTYRNIEIILIDDGSPDLCGKICDQKAKGDVRIQVIHQKNAGQSAARNVGLDIAAGDYVVFVDSDDYIDVNMINTLLTLLIENDGDLIRCPFQFVSEYENFPFRSLDPIGEVNSYTSRDAFNIFINAPYQFAAIVWGALYKKSLFDNIRFPVGLIYEEGYVLPKIFLKCKKLLFVNKVFTYYRINKHGTMATSAGTDKALKSVDDWREIHFLLADIYPEFRIATCQKWIEKYLNTYNQIINSQNIDKDNYYKNYIKNELRDNVPYFKCVGIGSELLKMIEQTVK